MVGPSYRPQAVAGIVSVWPYEQLGGGAESKDGGGAKVCGWPIERPRKCSSTGVLSHMSTLLLKACLRFGGLRSGALGYHVVVHTRRDSDC